MPQNGIHALAGMATRKWMPKKEWLIIGLVLGNMAPDLDNLVVAYATLAKLPDAEHFHRTFTHSIFTVAAMLIVFYTLSLLTKKERWHNFGLGFGSGILMHMALDLIFWFNGVELLWPLGGEVNFWKWFTVPDWLKILLNTGEFLFFGVYMLALASFAHRSQTDVNRRGAVKTWSYIEFGLFVVFTLLFFLSGMNGLIYQIYGGLYLLSMIVSIVLSIRMKNTIEAL